MHNFCVDKLTQAIHDPVNIFLKSHGYRTLCAPRRFYKKKVIIIILSQTQSSFFNSPNDFKKI